MLVVVVRRAIVVAALLGLVLWPGSAVAQSTPHLAILTIDVWPEFDRPASVLVIYRGQVAPDTPLPDQIKIRIPSSAGEPSAVALPHPGSESAPVNQWLDLAATKQVTLTRSGDWIEVRFAPSSRLFNLEYYDPLNTATFDRRYTLVWPGDLAADAVAVNVREPLGAADFQSTPVLPPGATDDEGLVAHQWAPGGLAAGQPLTLALSYRREDKRTSVEALQLATPVPTQPPAPSLVTAPKSPWLLIVALVAGLALVAVCILWYVRSRQAAVFRPYEPPRFRHAQGRRSVRTSRGTRPRPQPRRTVIPSAETSQEAGFCTQCGKLLRPDDVFCSRCGTRIKGR